MFITPTPIMKVTSQLLSGALLLGAFLSTSPSWASDDKQQGNRRDTVNAVQTMRVVFLPGSTAKNFRIGIESNHKCDVNIQVINQHGMVVYSDVIEKVTRKVEERDFSWLKRGEYTVKVMNQDGEYQRKLVL
jgi:hypothetical protein